jgi:predicted  nucleic acid-binding Zn-ribbon protein
MSDSQHSQRVEPVDEIDLVELAATFWQHKWLFLVVASLCGLVGAVFALTRTPVYEFSTTIEIGTKLVGDDPVLIEQPQTVAAKLQQNYIPEAIRAYEGELQQSGNGARNLSVAVDTPSDTNLVVLRSQGPEALAAYYLPLHERVVGHLADDHGRESRLERVRLRNQLEAARLELETLTDDRVLRVERDELNRQLSSERDQLAQLNDQEALLRAELDNIDSQDSLVRSRLEELGQFVEQARQRRSIAQEQVQGGTDSMVLMLLDNELQRDIDRQTELEERLTIQLPEKRATLRTQLEANQREQVLQQEVVTGLEARYEKLLLDQERRVPRAKANVTELETRMENFRETKPVLPPQQSLKPVGTGKALILALALVVGVLLGVVVVLGRVFIQSVVTRIQLFVVSHNH